MFISTHLLHIDLGLDSYLLRQSIRILSRMFSKIGCSRLFDLPDKAGLEGQEDEMRASATDGGVIDVHRSWRAMQAHRVANETESKPSSSAEWTVFSPDVGLLSTGQEFLSQIQPYLLLQTDALHTGCPELNMGQSFEFLRKLSPHNNLRLYKRILPEVVESVKLCPEMPQYAIRRAQVKVEVRQRIFREILLPTLKLEITHSGLHDDGLVDSAVHCLLVDASQDLNRPRDAVLQLGKCSFVVFQEDVVHDS